MYKYPVRCVIVDADGYKFGAHEEFVARTPPESYPHLGKHGLAEEVDDDMFSSIGIGYRIKIILDDGNIIYGDECWWMPEKDFIKEEELFQQKIRKSIKEIRYDGRD
jgi:hypothetical protein